MPSLFALCTLPARAQLPPPTSLPETVVTAPRFAETASALPFGVSVLTADEIQAAGVSTVNEAVMKLLGVVGRQDFFGGGDFSLDLRGFGSTADSNQIVVVDGIRLSEADQGGTRLVGIPIDSVERIEVLRGSGAVLYGEGATGGVIVITTKAGTGAARRNTASLSYGAGSYGLRDARVNATLASGGLSMDFSGTQRNADNHRDNFRSETDAGSLAVQWSNDRVRLGARYARDELETRLPGALSADQFATNPKQTNNPDDHASINNTRTSVFGELFLGGWQLGADAGWRDKAVDSQLSGFPFAFNIDANNYSLRARREAQWGGYKNILVAGTDYGRWEREVLGSFGSTARQTSRGWYLKDDVTLPGVATRISAGVRTEKLNKTSTNASTGLADRQTAWELGASQSVGAGFTLYGRLGRSFRLANVDEFSFTSPGVDLLAQRSHDLELGSRLAYAGGKVELRLYRSNLRNEIGFDPSAAGPFGPGANVNFDPTRRQGLELDTSHRLARAVTLRVNAAWRESTFRSGAYAGNDVPLAPTQSVAVRADWQPLAQHRVTGGVNWVSSQHPDFDNRCRMPSYATADLRYAYHWQQVELSLGVSNLFDRNFYTQAFTCVSGVTNGIFPEAGRAFTATARVRF